jgi:predicted O-methyltransferase YrrM
MQRAKIAWYLVNLRNLIIAAIGTLIHCVLHPKQFAKLFFSLFSTLNEFYQVSHGRLQNFEDSPLYGIIKKDNVFCRSNVFNIEAIVTRPNETQILSTLACALKPRAVFEIGTYNGFTTLHLAYNTPEDSKIFTLDLPPDFEVKDKTHYSYDDLQVVELSKKNIARRVYRKDPLNRKIVELFGDSEQFDFSPYYGKIDMVFIDGNHSYPYVKSDTENAFKMLSEQGIIVWHDFDYIIHRDVFKYLNQLAREYKIYSIPHTRFAIYGKKM